MSVYCAADWHGCYWIWAAVKKILKPEDKLYFLGDAADRGQDGWRIIKEILNDNRITYLKGNHEDLMIKAIGKLKPESLNENYFYWNSDMELWFWNGGKTTYHAIISDDNITPEEKVEYLHRVAALPFCTVYHNVQNQNILLSHAGCDNIDTAEYWDEEKFLWDRTHFSFYDTWYGNEDEIIVHGHTPIELLIEEQEHNIKWLINKEMKENILNDSHIKIFDWDRNGAYWYGQGHKVNIDTGAVWNNFAVLIDLDTWEEIIIKK